MHTQQYGRPDQGPLSGGTACLRSESVEVGRVFRSTDRKAAHVDPHGPLCDRCYETLDRPPRFRYANMLFLHLVGPDQAARIAEYAYESCATFAGWRALSIRLNLQRQHGHERRPAPLQHIPIRHHGDGVDH